jgi:hypothetical protein
MLFTTVQCVHVHSPLLDYYLTYTPFFILVSGRYDQASYG